MKLSKKFNELLTPYHDQTGKPICRTSGKSIWKHGFWGEPGVPRAVYIYIYITYFLCAKTLAVKIRTGGEAKKYPEIGRGGFAGATDTREGFVQRRPEERDGAALGIRKYSECPKRELVICQSRHQNYS